MMKVSFPDADFTRRLCRMLEAGRQEAARRGHAVLVSLTVAIPSVEPVLLFNRARTQERIFWEQPSREFAMVAFGAAVRLTSYGESRFSQLSTAWRRLLSRAVVDAASSCPLPSPVSLGGFAFASARTADPAWEEYPDALLLLPRYLFLACQGSSWLSVNLLVEPDSDQQITADALLHTLQEFLQEEGSTIREEQAGNLIVQENDVQRLRWMEAITSIVNEIDKGALEKLVLARQLHASSPCPFDPGAIIRRLRARYSHCTLFAFVSSHSCFVGATPERLVRLEGRTVRTDCLAGSTNRGDTDAEDRALGERLLTDPKERREHAFVMEALRNILAPLCARLRAPDTPTLLRMPNVQHLYSPLEGVLKQDGDIFGLVEQLHPTPATGGLPRETTRTLLRAYEGFDRGWYAGPVGWVDGHGGGEFAVAIRSALLRGREARLYAGCGIVAGSDPEREYAESCLKLRPMLWAMST